MSSVTVKQLEDADHPDHFLWEAGVGGLSFLEVDEMSVAAAQGIQEGGTYVSSAGQCVTVKGFPTDLPSRQKKVLYMDSQGQLVVSSLHHFITRYHYDGQASQSKGG